MQGIYKLLFMDTNKVYVGKLTYIPARFSKHLATLIKGTHHNSGMLLYYNRTGNLPQLCILEIVEDVKDLDHREMFWIDNLQAFSEGFNLTKGGEGGLHGQLHINALYTDNTYYDILVKLADTDDTTTSIANSLNVSSSVVSNILQGQLHLWLKAKYPQLYLKMESKNRACGRQKIYSEEVYVAALFLLANTDSPIDVILDLVGLPKLILYDISKGQLHQYLQLLYPTEYALLMNKKGQFTRGRKQWPSVISPEGEIFEVANSSKFAKEHNLDTGGFSRLLNGKQKSQKGWKLCI